MEDSLRLVMSTNTNVYGYIERYSNCDSLQTNYMSASIDLIIRKAKAEVLHKKLTELATDEDVFQIAQQMLSKTIDYSHFRMLRESCPNNLKKHFSSRNFLILKRNSKGEIDRDDFLRFVQRSIDVESAILHLLSYSVDSPDGYVNEKELERYIYDSIPDMIGCKNLPESFFPFYVFTSARRFFFFLDPRKHRKLHISKLAHSTIMEEFLFIKRLAQYEKDGNENIDLMNHLNSNWFSGESARMIYSTYIDLDKDRNGMLSQRELIGLNICGVPQTPCQLTSTAISRIFDEYITYTPKEMDYKTFLDLILALENKSNSQSVMYFWRVLDIDKKGKLSKEVIEYFYKDIHTCLKALSYEAPPVNNIITEIYDILLCPETIDGPTYEEFLKSGQAHTVITMLIDVHGFWSYDNRESLLQQQQQQQLQMEEEREAAEALEKEKQERREQQQKLQRKNNSQLMKENTYEDADYEYDEHFEEELDMTQPHQSHGYDTNIINESKGLEAQQKEQNNVVDEEEFYDDDFFD